MTTASQSAMTPDSEPGFNLGDLFGFLWDKKIRLVLTASVVFVLGGYYVINMPKIYVASGTLLLGSSENSLSLGASLSGLTSSGSEQMDTYMEFIRSRQFVERLVDELELRKYAEFQSSSPLRRAGVDMDHAIQVFLSNLTLERVGSTDLLRVSFASQSPELAAEVTNYLGPAFFLYHSSMRREKALDTSKWLNSQLGGMQTRLDESEQELQNFLRENSLIDVKSQIELARSEIATLLNEKLQNDKALAGVKATVDQVRAAGNNTESLLRVPWILQNSMVVSLRSKIIAQEQAMNEVSKRYKSKHHRYIAVRTTLDTLMTEQRDLLGKLVASLEQEYITLASRRDTLTTQIEEVKETHNELGRHEVQLSRLKRKVDSTQQLYEMFLNRLQEAEMMKDIGNEDDFAVVDFASVPARPSKPKIPILLAMVGIFSMTVSIALWLFFHLLSDRKSRYLQLLRKLDVPVLAELPKLSKVKSPRQLSEFGQKHFQFSESVRSLRTSVMVKNSERENRIIAVTGIRLGDGKTSVSVSLAQSFGRLEKALLLDTDLRAPSIAKAFGLPKDHPGITDFISRKVKFSQCHTRVEGMQLTVVPSGPVPSDPMVYISKPRFQSILQKLGILYERVIIEMPSVNSFSDALILSKYVDGLVLVCDPNTTESAELVEAIQKLRDNGAPLLGVVFNKVKNVPNRLPRNSRSRRFLRRILFRSARA